MIPYISIIIPAYNEHTRLPAAIDKIIKWRNDRRGYRIELIIVCNGCTDDTPAIALNAAAQYKDIRVINITAAGKGRAVRAGMLAAAGRWRYLADCDLSTPIDILPRFITAALESGASIVIGNRNRAGDSIARAVCTRVYKMLSGILVPGIEDTQAGFKLFANDVIDKIFTPAVMTGWSLDIELLYLARRAGLAVVSLPIPWVHDKDSRVRIIRDSVKMVFDLITIYRQHKRA